MANRSRVFLKNIFKQNAVPTEQNFADLIDSYYNPVDDKLRLDSRGLVVGNSYKKEDAPENGVLVEGTAHIGSVKIDNDLTLGSGIKITAFSNADLADSSSSSIIPTQGAVKSYVDTKANLTGNGQVDFAVQNLSINGNFSFSSDNTGIHKISTDGSFSGPNDHQTLVTQQAIKTALDAKANKAGDQDLDFKANNLTAASVTTDELISSELQVTDLSVAGQLQFPNQARVKTITTITDQFSAPIDNKTLVTQQAIKEYVDTKANKQGDTQVEFATANLTVNGSLQVGAGSAINTIKATVDEVQPSKALLTESAVVSYVNSVVSNGAATSDARLKTQVQPLSDCLAKILQLQGVSFTWAEASLPVDKQFGFIAQQVEEVIPELVTTNNEGYKAIAYFKLIAILTEAIKEQQRQIDALSQSLAKSAAAQ